MQRFGGLTLRSCAATPASASSRPRPAPCGRSVGSRHGRHAVRRRIRESATCCRPWLTSPKHQACRSILLISVESIQDESELDGIGDCLDTFCRAAVIGVAGRAARNAYRTEDASRGFDHLTATRGEKPGESSQAAHRTAGLGFGGDGRCRRPKTDSRPGLVRGNFDRMGPGKAIAEQDLRETGSVGDDHCHLKPLLAAGIQCCSSRGKGGFRSQ